MHVAWLGKKSPFCGNVTYGLAITDALRSRGHRVSFCHFDTPAAQLGRMFKFGEAREDPQQQGQQSGSPEALAAGAPFDITLPYLVKSQVYTIPSPLAAKALRESLQRLKPDLVHASLTLSPLDFWLPDICKQQKLPLVATFHPPFDAQVRNPTAATQQLTYQLYAPSLARYDRVIVFSQLQALLLERCGVPAERLAVIPNGVDPDLWSPGPPALRQRLGGHRVFLYMGRLAAEKNVEALLKAWRTVRPAGCVLVIAGDGPLRSTLPLGSDEGSVVWWGYAGCLEERLGLLRTAEVFILPSLVEGLSLALLEAMAAGTACVATDAGADGEVLAGGAGLVMSTEAVAVQLRTILPILRDHPRFVADLGVRARERILERYSLAANVTALEDLYGRLTAARPRSEAALPAA